MAGLGIEQLARKGLPLAYPGPRFALPRASQLEAFGLQEHEFTGCRPRLSTWCGSGRRPASRSGGRKGEKEVRKIYYDDFAFRLLSSISLCRLSRCVLPTARVLRVRLHRILGGPNSMRVMDRTSVQTLRGRHEPTGSSGQGARYLGSQPGVSLDNYRIYIRLLDEYTVKHHR